MPIHTPVPVFASGNMPERLLELQANRQTRLQLLGTSSSDAAAGMRLAFQPRGPLTLQQLDLDGDDHMRREFDFVGTVLHAGAVSKDTRIAMQWVFLADESVLAAEEGAGANRRTGMPKDSNGVSAAEATTAVPPAGMLTDDQGRQAGECANAEEAAQNPYAASTAAAAADGAAIGAADVDANGNPSCAERVAPADGATDAAAAAPTDTAPSAAAPMIQALTTGHSCDQADDGATAANIAAPVGQAVHEAPCQQASAGALPDRQCCNVTDGADLAAAAAAADCGTVGCGTATVAAGQTSGEGTIPTAGQSTRAEATAAGDAEVANVGLPLAAATDPKVATTTIANTTATTTTTTTTTTAAAATSLPCAGGQAAPGNAPPRYLLAVRLECRSQSVDFLDPAKACGSTLAFKDLVLDYQDTDNHMWVAVAYDTSSHSHSPQKQQQLQQRLGTGLRAASSVGRSAAAGQGLAPAELRRKETIAALRQRVQRLCSL